MSESGLPREQLIKAAIRGLEKEPDEMTQLLAQAPDAVRRDLEREMHDISLFHAQFLIWMEHGVWEAVVEHWVSRRTDASTKAA